MCNSCVSHVQVILKSFENNMKLNKCIPHWMQPLKLKVFSVLFDLTIYPSSWHHSLYEKTITSSTWDTWIPGILEFLFKMPCLLECTVGIKDFIQSPEEESIEERLQKDGIRQEIIFLVSSFFEQIGILFLFFG